MPPNSPSQPPHPGPRPGPHAGPPGPYGGRPPGQNPGPPTGPLPPSPGPRPPATGPLPSYGGPQTGQQSPYTDPRTQQPHRPVPKLPDTVRVPSGPGGRGPGGGAPGGGGPRKPIDRRLLIGGAAAVALIAVLAIVLAFTLSGQSTPTAGGKLGPMAGTPGQEHGVRPVTQIEQPPSGRTLNVAQDGSGQFRTISEAAQQTQPGDTVVIAAGTYQESVQIPKDGAEGRYITYQAAPGAEVVISGDADTDGLVEVRDRSWIKFIGLKIRNSSEHGLYGSDANHILVQDTEVSGSQDGGIVFIDGSDIQVLHSQVTNSNAQGPDAKNEAVSMSNINGFEVAWSVVENCGEEGIDAKYEARNGKIHDNTTRGNRGPNIYVDAANTIEIYNNTVLGATGEGKAGIFLGVEDVSETRRTYNVKLYNNVITGNAGGGINFYVESEGTFSDLSIVNNTIANNTGDGINPRNYSFSGTNVLRNNIVTGNGRDSTGNMGVFAADHNLFGSSPVGTNPVQGAVEFVDAATGDLQLAPGSAGIGAGVADGAPQADVLGVARTDGKIDLGAFQTK